MRRPFVVVFVALAAACGDSSTTNYGTRGLADDPALEAPPRDAGTLDPTDGGELTPDADTPLPPPPDGDGDGIPDVMDCDPASPALRRRALEDDLSTNKGLFAAPDGFPAESWNHDGAVFRQTRLANAADTSLYVNEKDIGDVLIDIRAASTELAAITPRLRQIFVVVGATSNGGQLTAHGCGIEVVEGETPEQKTSVVRLSGPSNAVVTTPLSRVARTPVQANEEFGIQLRLESGTLTCTVTQGAATTTTATAANLQGVVGSVGLFTRQTKALFKSMRVCQIK